MEVRGPIPFTSGLQGVQAQRIYSAVKPISPVGDLTAGRVSLPADPALAPGVKPAQGTLSLYTRAADRIEAATGVQLGQIFDRQA